jgi:hypothetical protein
MLEQVIAADLCNDIEMNFKLMSIKSPFYHKFGVVMKALTELIDWDDFYAQIAAENADYRLKYLVISFYKLIGMDVGVQRLVDFSDEIWEKDFKEISSTQLKYFVDNIFTQDYRFLSNQELNEVKKAFLDVPDISGHNISQLRNKNLIMFNLFIRQLLVFAQLKNFLSLAQCYVMMAKDKLKEVSREWPSKKGFLEGAYKILLFKFVQIRNGEVIIAKDEEDEQKSDIIKDIQNELDECIHMTTELSEAEQELAFKKN